MQANQSLLLYKRHLGGCEVHKSRIPIKSRRFWMECACPIWIVGRTPNGDLVPRQSTGFSDLKKAEALRASFLTGPTADQAQGDTLAACIEKYLASRQEEIGERTYQQIKLLLGRLSDFCASRGVYLIADLNVDLMETFKVSGLPSLASTSRATSVAKLRCFLKDGYRRGWLREPLVEKVRPVKAVYEQKEPYTDAEVNLILEESLKLKGGTCRYARHPKTFRLLLDLMLETGLRVGDAINFDPSILVKGETLWVYTFLMQKQKRAEKQKYVEVFLTERLKRAIDECQWLSPRLPFSYGTHRTGHYLSNEVYSRMQTIGERCGVADCRPHRLRDTFAVRSLLSGLHLDDVSRLLGHSSVKITEAYYSRWTTGRKLRLERLVAETLVDA